MVSLCGFLIWDTARRCCITGPAQPASRRAPTAQSTRAGQLGRVFIVERVYRKLPGGSFVETSGRYVHGRPESHRDRLSGPNRAGLANIRRVYLGPDTQARPAAEARIN